MMTKPCSEQLTIDWLSLAYSPKTFELHQPPCLLLPYWNLYQGSVIGLYAVLDWCIPQIPE